MVLPFLSIYIETFGSFSAEYVQKWSGLVFGVTFMTAFLAAPFWGRFGDRFGRKKILIIAGFGLALCVFLMGLVNSVGQLFVLRLFMGVFTGFISTSQALISAQTPKEISGKVLGTLQTGNVSGALFGPLFGGLLADTFGFELTFILTAITLSIAAVIVLVGVKEFIIESKSAADNKQYSRKEVLQYILLNPVLLMIMIVSFIIQVANFSVQPLLALYVSQLSDTKNIALLSGVAFSATGLGNLMFTRKWGRLGDKIGYEKVLIILLVLSTVFYLPQAFVTNIWQLVFLRFLLGISIGGIIPCRMAYIRQVAPLSVQGEVLGYNSSFRFAGNVVGPIMGGILSGYIGISSVFFVTCGLFILCAILLKVALAKNELKAHQLSKSH